MDKNASRKGWRWLLIIPFIGTLWPPFFAKSSPQLAGFPFFYWYLVLWIVLVGVITGAVYFITDRRNEN